VDPDPDPGGPKTRGSGGSGSATLLSSVLVPVSVLDNIFTHFSLLSNNPNSGTVQPKILSEFLSIEYRTGRSG
jgi:hypothetical protein